MEIKRKTYSGNKPKKKKNRKKLIDFISFPFYVLSYAYIFSVFFFFFKFI